MYSSSNNKRLKKRIRSVRHPYPPSFVGTWVSYGTGDGEPFPFPHDCTSFPPTTTVSSSPERQKNDNVLSTRRQVRTETKPSKEKAGVNEKSCRDAQPQYEGFNICFFDFGSLMRGWGLQLVDRRPNVVGGQKSPGSTVKRILESLDHLFRKYSFSGSRYGTPCLDENLQ